MSSYNKEYYEKNKDKWKQYYMDNLEEGKIKRHNTYLKNKEKVAEQGRQWRKDNLDKARLAGALSYHRRKNDPINIKHFILKNAKSRATQKGLEFSINENDIILPLICPILKIPFNRDTRKYGYSLDRKDPNKGYTKDNIWVISQIANAMKWDSTREERILFANWVLSLEGGD
jgi:hypothetical protein